MPGHELAQTILLGRNGASLMAYFVLLSFCGLLRPLERRARLERRAPLKREVNVELPRSAQPDNAVTSPVKLNAIELSLLAELSLEQARAYEALVDDPSQGPEIRRGAALTAMAWRKRARAFQLQARSEGASPMVPGERSLHAYTGPERRTQTRRREARRTAAHAPGWVERRDRRSGPDRRQGDRRRPEQIAV